MLGKIFKDLFYVFYPILCNNCENYLNSNERLLCVKCRHDLPYSHYTQRNKNPVETMFFGRVPIEAGTSLFLFEQNGMAQTLIHKLKYQGKEEIGSFAGFLLGEELKKNNLYKKLDCIIPVPLLPKKQKKRGYNQLTKFAESLSKTLNVKINYNDLIKISGSETQTKKNKYDRWKNTTESFHLKNSENLENKHILLIDDVITTGATIEACIHELLKAKNTTIYVATIAHTANF